LAELTDFLQSISGPERKAEVACIVETTHGLLITALLEAGFAVYPVNPNTIDRRRSASGAKTDQIGAYLLAKVGRADFAELHRLQPDSTIIAALKVDSLIQSQTRLVNQIIACLKAYYPVALHLFSKLQQPSALTFLQTYPTPAAAMAASIQELEMTLRKRRHSSPTLQADDITTRTKSRLLLILVKQLLPVVESIAEYDRVFLVFGEPGEKSVASFVPLVAEIRHHARAAAAKEQSRPCHTSAF
jgi:hypothetical protein